MKYPREGARGRRRACLHVPLRRLHVLLVVMAALFHDNSRERIVDANAFVHHLVGVLVDVLPLQFGQPFQRPVGPELAALIAALLFPIL